MSKIYCAGPLFNPKEKEEMLEIATALEETGFDTFLPQRDGLELNILIQELLTDGMDADTANKVLSRAIFALDVYQVIEGCNGIFVNLNGRVPDEGAVSEAAIAWSVGKPMVAYKSDMRTVFSGGDNPLVTGLFEFSIFSCIDSAVTNIKQQMSLNLSKSKTDHSISKNLFESLSLGNNIWDILKDKNSLQHITALLQQTA